MSSLIFRQSFLKTTYFLTRTGGCKCPDLPAVIAAPPPDKLFPKCTIGMSIWVLILLLKFAFYQPLYRVLAEFCTFREKLNSQTGRSSSRMARL